MPVPHGKLIATPKWRGIAIDGIALILFRQAITIGADGNTDLDLPIRAYLKPHHVTITRNGEGKYRLTAGHPRGITRINGQRVSDKTLEDGDFICMGGDPNSQGVLTFSLPVRDSDTALLELPFGERGFDFPGFPECGVIRQVVLLSDYFALGHDSTAHVPSLALPCCELRFDFFEEKLMAEARSGWWDVANGHQDKWLFVECPATHILRGLGCVHHLSHPTITIPDRHALRIFTPFPKCLGDESYVATS